MGSAAEAPASVAVLDTVLSLPRSDVNLMFLSRQDREGASAPRVSRSCKRFH